MNSSDTSAGEVLQGCLSEMDYTISENQFGMEVPASIPCQLRFVDDVDQDTERFHEALEERGYGSLDHDPDRTMGGRNASGDTPYYDGEICSREHYGRLRIWVGRRNVVRLFPREEFEVTEDELADIIGALEVGFDAGLAHDPIERGDSSE